MAILLVMAHHFEMYGGTADATVWPDEVVFKLSRLGWTGVDLFFVLSGFLITRILYHTKNSGRYFRTFYARRVLRIFPLYYGFLFLLLVGVPVIVEVGPAFRSLLDEQLWYWTYLVNLKIGIEGGPEYIAIGHFWTLAIEEQFYLMWPVIVFLLGRRGIMFVCAACVVESIVFRVAMIWGGYSAAYVMTPARLDALTTGAFLAIAFSSPRACEIVKRYTRPSLVILPLLLVGLSGWGRHLDSWDLPIATVGLTLIALFFGATLSLAVTSPPYALVPRLLANRFLRFFGRYSYALYVFHHLVAIYLPRWGFAVRDVPTFMGSQIPGFVLFSIVATAISLVAALSSWYLIESRFLALKRYFPYDPARRTLRATPAE